ncbi:MAG: DUF4339 domain-containing protein [Gemmatimonadota bacterium]|nr:DUF4339 domain-containing protein [Gemmatimonadota bacterium]
MWFYLRDGAEIGPIPLDELLALIDGGSLTAESWVWHQGMEKWLPVAGVRELSGRAAEIAGWHPQPDYPLEALTGDDATGEMPVVAPPAPQVSARPQSALSVVREIGSRDVAPRNPYLRRILYVVLFVVVTDLIWLLITFGAAPQTEEEEAGKLRASDKLVVPKKALTSKLESLAGAEQGYYLLRREFADSLPALGERADSTIGLHVDSTGTLHARAWTDDRRAWCAVKIAPLATADSVFPTPRVACTTGYVPEEW